MDDVSPTRTRFRVWPAALLALVGFIGAGAIATDAASSTDAPACGPSADAPAYQTTQAGFVGSIQLRLVASTHDTDTPTVCVRVDPADLDLAPANPRI